MIRDTWLRRIYWTGVAVRIAVFAVLVPRNSDDHWGVVRFVLDHHRLPTSEVMSQSFHPPLYYVLVAPVAWLFDRGAAHEYLAQKATQGISLLLSLATLWLVARFIDRTDLVTSSRAKRHALAFVAFLPQFVIFGLFISNDTLAALVGAWIAIAAVAYAARPARGPLLVLATSIGVGLLTKGTFLAAVPVALALVLYSERRLTSVVLCALVMGGVGCYKFVENYERLGRPVVHNMDFQPAWYVAQRGPMLQGFDLPLLVGDPFNTSEIHRSVPMMFYATTWYPYLEESNLRATRAHAGIARTLILLGLIPTALGLIGLFRARDRGRLVLAGLFVMTLALVSIAGFKYEAWSCFQGRLLFPSMVSIVCAMAWGYEVLRPRLERVVNGALVTAYLAFACFYVLEISSALPIQISLLRRILGI